ncbi:ankyrin [Serendipita vermifera]|nr:ankyrin [Serendipita vermifera]
MAERDITQRLRRAVKENNLALVKRLILRTDMRNPDPAPARYTSLAWAAVCGCEDNFEYLLLMGHDDEELSKDVEKNTILCLLAGAPGNSPSGSVHMTMDDATAQASMRMARMYLQRFPFITDWCNQHGKTALHIAASNGNDEFVRMLYDFDADIDLSDLQGNTPLHYASAWGHIPIVQFLIEKGCGFNAKNNDGFTPSDYAYS